MNTEKVKAVVNSDASYCDCTCACGWAVWIVIGQKTIRKSSMFKSPLNNPTSAEIKAILNGIYIAKTNGATCFEVFTDCEPAIKKITDEPIYTDIIGVSRSDIKFSWVKAHTDAKDIASEANRWCDREAKVHMKNMRKSIKELILKSVI